MKVAKSLLAGILGFVGSWFFLWDIMAFMTKGVNTGVWDYMILNTGMPSIFIGFCMLSLAAYLGFNVLFK